MHRRNFITHARWRTTASATLALAVAFTLSGAAAGALAQTTAKPEGLTLSQAFEAAWARQPELAALAARRDAARAQQQAAQSWTPEPVAVEVTGKTDRLNRKLIDGAMADHCHKTNPRIATRDEYRAMLADSL